MSNYYSNGATPEAKLLFYELKKLGIKAELEKFDGFKTIDIAVTSAMVNIEVDGGHHHSPNQSMSDLKRTLYSLKKGYLTLRIPNSLIQNNLEETAQYISQFIKESRNQIY